MISFSMLQMGFLISLDESYLGGPLELGAQTTVEVVKMSYYLTTYIHRILEIHMSTECVVFAPFNVEEMNM